MKIRSSIKRTRRFGFRGGIHMYNMRATWRQEIRNLVKWMCLKEEKEKNE